MTHTLEEMERELSGTLHAPKFTKEGKFEYVKWSDSVRELNRIFGELGWNDELISTTRLEHGFNTVVRLTIYLPDGQTRHHDGSGYGAIPFVDEKDKYGKILLPGSLQAKRGQAEDKAVKEAYSDALSRACKRWTALGLALYGGDDGAEHTQNGHRTQTTQQAAARNGGASDATPAPGATDATVASGKVRWLLKKHDIEGNPTQDRWLTDHNFPLKTVYTPTEFESISDALKQTVAQNGVTA